jgi:hypothetical protein
MLEDEDAEAEIEHHVPHVSTEPGGKHFDEPAEQYFSNLYGDQLADEALNVDDSLQTRVGEEAKAQQHTTRQAQIVDEQKFIARVSDILSSHADDIPWQPDALNGGATERAVVTRGELARWMGSSNLGHPGAPQGHAGAGDEGVSYVLDAASDERGLQLIGEALVLAGMADYTRLGFAGRQPMLVAYRTPDDEGTLDGDDNLDTEMPLSM